MYKKGSGREAFLKNTWKDEKKSDLKKSLTAIQYKVTQECGTEPPFKNEYWDNHKEGIYVDVVTGEPLFSSLDKYDSGTGSVLNQLIRHLYEKEDKSAFMTRVEVKKKASAPYLLKPVTSGIASTPPR